MSPRCSNRWRGRATLRWPALALALAVILVSGAARAATIEVTMKNIGFAPAEVHAKVGDTIKWTNEDFVAHTATARNGDWNFTIGVHKSAQVVLKKAGSIDYYCLFHPNMKGHIEVAPE